MKNTKFEKISPVLDDEHTDVFNAIDKLYEVCDKHWKTEQKMYKEGLKKMPSNHENVKIEWKEHAKDHKELLKNIKNMKKQLITHISEKDAIHFHWT